MVGRKIKGGDESVRGKESKGGDESVRWERKLKEDMRV